VFEFGTHLTKQGMGFPQYCNDDIVIPGLIKLGYSPEDAQNYVVAACWEYIIPDCGADYHNIATMDFPAVVGKVITDTLKECDSFEELMSKVKDAIKNECDKIVLISRPMTIRVLTSIFIDGCIEKLSDMWHGGAKYYNYGCHGAGIANAADALAAVKKNIFDDKTLSKEELLLALSKNFEGFDELRNLLKNSPKMGNNDDYVDNIAGELMEAFSTNINNRKNSCGGIWRAGTGSAMEYIWKGAKCPATADGRKAGEPYSSSFSPSLDVKTKGILSVLQSFTKYDLKNTINGGPLTIEIHDTVFRNEDGIKKTAMLVKNFICLGGHQLQINSVNRERLLDAQKHPENYPNLIVRVWGWSGYFNELDIEYQNHIIRRAEHTF
ncbi:MAG: pyruvate formate-lyase, partial [Clostridia bacterium]|nr:pyruvate formate-lyase [Clostridia bacterium]